MQSISSKPAKLLDTANYGGCREHYSRRTALSTINWVRSRTSARQCVDDGRAGSARRANARRGKSARAQTHQGAVRGLRPRRPGVFFLKCLCCLFCLRPSLLSFTPIRLALLMDRRHAEINLLRSICEVEEIATMFLKSDEFSAFSSRSWRGRMVRDPSRGKPVKLV
jgi:hypothetical protein